MNREKKLKWAFAPVAIATFATPFFFASCDTIKNADGAVNAVCCTAFKPGTNMVTVDWGLDGDANVQFGAAMQAIGDISATAQGMTNDLGVACKGLAVDLGVDPNAVTDPDPNKFTTGWCSQAATAVKAVRAKAKLSISVQPPVCHINVSAKLDCRAQCDASAKCTLTPAQITASCEPGKVSGQCTGECKGECEGSANVAVTCNAECEGECDGECDGTAVSGRCEGTCAGKCRGTCAVDGSAKATCEGTCSGTCSVDFQAPRCDGKFTPPKGMCEASASCSGSCDASASAKAECTPPSVQIDADASVSVQIAALQKWLPQIYLIGQARVAALGDEVQSLVSIAGDFSDSFSSSSTATAAFCILPATTSINDAADNLTATVSASGTILAAVED